MIVAGLDPGATTGWVRYCTDERRVIGAGVFAEEDVYNLDNILEIGDCVIVERPRGYGPTFPQVVECGLVAGRIYEVACHNVGGLDVHWMLRKDVCRILEEAVRGQPKVRNDATAWAALLELHGGVNAAKKCGPLHGVKSHARAALAVAVAFALQAATEQTGREAKEASK